MPDQTDPDFLRNEEYGDASNLSIRTQIQDRYRTNPQSWFHWVFERFDLPLQSQILELGCGPGDLWLENLYRLPSSWEVVLSDLSSGMLHDARTRLAGPGPFTFVQADAQAIPFPMAAFEAVIGIGLLDHIPDRDKALEEIRRVLKPGGIFYASAGGRAHLQEIEFLVHPFLMNADYGGDPSRFGLENGAELLSAWFVNTRRERYANELVFNKPGPILAYVLSESSAAAELQGEKLAAFEAFLEHELSVQGEIRVATDKGLFIAQ